MVTQVHKKPRIRCSRGVNVAGRMKAVYEGASQGPRMGQKGMIGLGGPNAEIARSLKSLVERSRHQVRNNPYALRGKEIYQSSVVGNGIKARWKNKDIQSYWDIWINQCDADGLDNFYGLTKLCIGAEFESGEVLIRKRIRYPTDNLAVPLQLQVLEADRLDVSHTVIDPKKPVVMGIGFNSLGQRSTYHLWKYHPAELSISSQINRRQAVAADDIIHLFDRSRPEQIRGVPALTVVLLRLYEIDEMQDATLRKQKISQLFAWIVKKKTGSGSYSDSSDMSGIGTSSKGDDEQLEGITPEGIHYLGDNEEIQFSSPDGIGANYDRYLQTEFRALAVGLGMTYEQLTGDLTGVNYSSIRQGLLEFRRRIEQRQKLLLIHRMCRRVAGWFLDTLVLSGKVSLPGYWQQPWLYLPHWQIPRWDWIDPLKDAMGDLIEVRAGMSTLASKQEERGLDPEETLAALAEEQEAIAVLDSNPSKTAKTGALQPLEYQQAFAT